MRILLVVGCCLAALTSGVQGSTDACGCPKGTAFCAKTLQCGGCERTKFQLNQCRYGHECGCKPGYGICDDGKCGIGCWTSEKEAMACLEASTEESQQPEEPEPTPECVVKIKDQLSKTSCSSRHSCTGNKLTVKSGCRAVFTCNGRDVKCESESKRTKTCTCPNPTGEEGSEEQSEGEVITPGDKGDYQTSTGWYKTKSESQIKTYKTGMWMEPVRKPTTVHTYFPAMSFKKGDTFQLSMKWMTDGFYAVGHESKKDFDCAKADPTNQGRGISDRYLRCLGGTGDLRVGFFDSGGVRVGGNTCEGTDSSSESKYKGKPEWTCAEPTKDMDEPVNTKFDNYKGFQFRIEPHLSPDYTDVMRLKEATNDCEPHINLQLWTRLNAGEHGLMSDQCQHGKTYQCGYTKKAPEGTDAVGFGPNAPFNKEYDVVLTGHKLSDTEFHVHLKFANDEKYLAGTFDDSFVPEKIDTLAITYTNSMRRYKFLKVWDVKTKNIALPAGWKGYGGPPPSESTGCVPVDSEGNPISES